MTDEELGLRERHGLDDEQIAFRRQAFQAAVVENNGDEAAAKVSMQREYPEDAVTCWRGNVVGEYDADMLQQMLEQCREPVERVDRRGLKIRIWRRPVLGHVYVLGLDPASGHGDDDVGAFLLDVTAGVQAGAFRGKCDPETAIEETALLAERYYHALVVIEKTGLGEGYVAEAKKIPGLSLWRRPRKPAENPETLAFITRAPGLDMSQAQRGLMQARVLTMVNRGMVLLSDRELIERLMNWDPLTEKHLDDMHSAFQLAAWGQEEAVRLAPSGSMRLGATNLEERPVGTPPMSGVYFRGAV